MKTYSQSQAEEDFRTNLYVLIAGLLIAGALMSILWFWIENFRCTSAWEHSRFKVQWGPFAGCQIDRGDGRWIPASSYREI